MLRKGVMGEGKKEAKRTEKHKSEQILYQN